MRRHLSSVTPSAKAENQLPPPVALLSAAIATAPFAFNQLDTPPAAAHAGTALGGGSLAPRACAQPLSRSARGRRELRRLNLPPSILSPPRLLPAAFWRASPPGPRRGRLPETGRRPDAGALLLCPRPLGRLRGTSKGAREPGSGAEMRRPRAHSFLSLPQRIFRVSLLRPHRRRTLRAGRLGSEAQKKGRAS